MMKSKSVEDTIKNTFFWNIEIDATVGDEFIINLKNIYLGTHNATAGIFEEHLFLDKLLIK